MAIITFHSHSLNGGDLCHFTQSNSRKIEKYSIVVCPEVGRRDFRMANSLCHNPWGDSVFYTAVLFLHKLPQMHYDGLNYPFDIYIPHIFIFVIYVHMNSILTYPWCLGHIYIDMLLLLQAQHIQKQKLSSLSNKVLILTPPVLLASETRNHGISKNVSCFLLCFSLILCGFFFDITC